MAGVFALQFVELSFLGHLRTEYLAAASVASIWLNVTSAFLWLGFGNALAALVSQVCGRAPTLGRVALGRLLVLCVCCGGGGAGALPLASR